MNARTAGRAAPRHARAWASLAAALLLVLGCAGPAGPPPAPSLRISELSDQGDARRRASLRLIQEGLDADVAGDATRAQSRYERAVQLDPTNPYAYLTIARHDIDVGSPVEGLRYLERAEQLLIAEGALSPGVEAHLSGLRGAALVAQGRTAEAQVWLARAQSDAPDVWGDGTLSADELR